MRPWWTLAVAATLLYTAGCTSSTTEPNVSTVASRTTSTIPPAPVTTPVTAHSPSTTDATTTTTAATTTVPVPPTLEVTDPENGAVVTTSEHTFRGRTDPGCTVDVGGRYFADVDDDGNWSIALKLRPGRNATTFRATGEAGLTATAQVRLTSYPMVTVPDDPRLRPETLTGSRYDEAVPEEFRIHMGMCVGEDCSFGVRVYFSDTDDRARYLVLYDKAVDDSSAGPAMWEIVDAVYVEFSADSGLEVFWDCWTSRGASDIDVLVAPESEYPFQPLLAWKGDPSIEGFRHVDADNAECEMDDD